MRGLLIANPNATTTDERTLAVLTAALSSVVGDLEVVTTTHRGHAGELGEQATAGHLDLVITLGGDGTVHEVVNGMLNGNAERAPALATLPGGSANVFARATGLPNDIVPATGAILQSLRAGRLRKVGLGRINGTWFTCNAGLGIDAEVVAAMEDQRAAGKKATPSRYVTIALREFFTRTDRRAPAMTILPTTSAPVDHVFLAVVQNCSPWTYLAGLPVNACPNASFESGLDVLAVRDMRVIPSLRVTGRLLRSSTTDVRSKGMYLGHDLQEFAVVATRPIALQVDGESMGETQHVTFESVPEALTIVPPS